MPLLISHSAVFPLSIISLNSCWQSPTLLSFEGITSLSVQPLHFITGLGCFIAFLSFIGVIWSVIVALSGNSVPGWASMTCIICLLGGVQLICLGVLGEYVGKIYMEVKQRPRYIISERTKNWGNTD